MAADHYPAPLGGLMRPIGYYVHHMGRGHLDRARVIAAHLGRPCTLIGTAVESGPGGFDILPLPDDAGAEGSASARADLPHALHFAPVGYAPVRARMASIAAWVAGYDPALMIVDVSVEVALFARLLSVPVLVVRLAGDRTDPAHLEAFRAAQGLIAPFPPQFEDSTTPDWVRAKTFYAGFIHTPAQVTCAAPADPNSITVVIGAGGTSIRIDDLAQAACATPDYTWHVCGTLPDSSDALPSNLHIHGFVADIDRHVARSGILIGGAGDGVMALAVHHGRRFICIPEVRPYREQETKAEALAACGAAIHREAWPHAAEWPALLHKAMMIDTQNIESLRESSRLADLNDLIERTGASFGT